MTSVARQLIVLEPLPVAYASWDEWRELRRSGEESTRLSDLAQMDEIDALAASPLAQLRTCPFCWGDRRVWRKTPEGYVPCACRECLGTGLWAPPDRAQDS